MNQALEVYKDFLQFELPCRYCYLDFNLLKSRLRFEEESPCKPEVKDSRLILKFAHAFAHKELQ